MAASSSACTERTRIAGTRVADIGPRSRYVCAAVGTNEHRRCCSDRGIDGDYPAYESNIHSPATRATAIPIITIVLDTK